MPNAFCRSETVEFATCRCGSHRQADHINKAGFNSLKALPSPCSNGRGSGQAGEIAPHIARQLPLTLRSFAAVFAVTDSCIVRPAIDLLG